MTDKEVSDIEAMETKYENAIKCYSGRYNRVSKWIENILINERIHEHPESMQENCNNKIKTLYLRKSW